MVNTEIRLIILFAAKDREALYSHLVCTRTQEKGAVTTQETDTDFPMSVQESSVEAWVGSGLLKDWGHYICTNANVEYFEGGCNYLHYLYHSLASCQITGREHSPTLQQKIQLRFTVHGPTHQNKIQFPPVSLFHQEASISLLSLSLRGLTE